MNVTDVQLKEMVNSAFNYAKQMFEEFGDFYPFGVSLDAEGKIDIRGTVKVDKEHDSPELILMLQQMYRTQVRAGEIFATAIGANVDIPPQLPADYPDGIGVFLETRESSRAFYLPYTTDGRFVEIDEGKCRLLVKYGQPIGIAMSPEIFCVEKQA